MLRHEFQPGKLIAGFALLATGVVYAGDAGGAWDAEWFVAIPLVVGGLCLAGVVASVTHAIRRARRAARDRGQRTVGINPRDVTHGDHNEAAHDNGTSADAPPPSTATPGSQSPQQ
ncbi:hypothetical protein ACFV6E_35050 [Streptomyces sp. NPDC059785]|uniref:hypothetical protein n=1 Tax=unclassified Streptomyces TaxID=2593676 RepID=UPI003653D763